MRLIIVGSALIGLVACNPTTTKFSRAEVATRAQKEMVGFSEFDVLSCMGPPARQAEQGNLAVWSYSGGGDAQAVVVAQPNMITPMATGQIQSRSCVANVSLQNGKVVKVDYLGRTGGLLTQGEQCGYLVANCVQ